MVNVIENEQRPTPTMSWVQVRGADGRTTLEAHWAVPAPVATNQAATHAA